MSDLSSLSKAVISGDRDKAVQLAMEAVSAGSSDPRPDEGVP